MNIREAMARYLPLIEEALQAALQTSHRTLAAHHGMMHYHLGWVDQRFQSKPAGGGKRLRPLLCLLACEAAGEDVQVALPAAAAIEILHNFSLVHDDIEDDSPTRRGRPAVWALWGVPQAINVGDALFALAHRTLGQLSEQDVPADRVLGATHAFHDTCVALTEGQYLDMSFEARLDVTVDEYVEMIRGKTAALMGLSTQLGALLAGAPADRIGHFHRFGRMLGIAFQIEDDILGIWGDEALMGKSAASDILEKKKTLPVVYALQSAVGERLREIYQKRELTPEDITSVLVLLEEVHARGYAERLAEEALQQALEALAATGMGEAALAPLQELAALLQGRRR
jgi:geranylgeranyl diphosphate synthase type I